MNKIFPLLVLGIVSIAYWIAFHALGEDYFILDGETLTVSPGSSEPSGIDVKADWKFDEDSKFRGSVFLTDGAQSSKVGAFTKIPIDYPSAFEGGMSIHRLGLNHNMLELGAIRRKVGIEYLGCFEMRSGPSLVASLELRSYYSDYRVCRVLSKGEGEPVQAVVGYLNPYKSQQPLDRSLERCAAEAAIWLERIALPDTSFAICMFVSDYENQVADLVVFEKYGGNLVVRAANQGEIDKAFPIGSYSVRESRNLERFTYFQKWKEDQSKIKESFFPELPDLAERIKARLKIADLKPYFEAKEVILGEQGIEIRIQSLSDARVRGGNKKNDNVRSAMLKLLCHDPKTAAFLDLQQLDAVVGFRLMRQNGAIWSFGGVDRTPCNPWGE